MIEMHAYEVCVAGATRAGIAAAICSVRVFIDATYEGDWVATVSTPATTWMQRYET